MSETNPTFNDGSLKKRPDYERYTNTEYKSNDRKRWEFVQVAPCPFFEDHVWVIQRLQGDYGTPNEDGHDENGWRPAREPAATRLVYMEMQDDGQVINVNKSSRN